MLNWKNLFRRRSNIILANELNSLIFEPAANWYGNTSFGWKGYDGTDYSIDSANVDITITAVNSPPAIRDFTKIRTESAVIRFDQTDFTKVFSDGDVGDGLIKIKIISLPADGVLGLVKGEAIEAVEDNQEINVSDLNTLVFKPNPNWYGTTSFTWMASDGCEYSGEAYVDIFVTFGFQIDTVNGWSLFPSVATLVDGSFVVVWCSNVYGGFQVFGQRYHANGDRIGNEFQVSVFDVGQYQEIPSISPLSDGGFMVVWEGYGVDGWGILGRRYNGDGDAVGNSFVVNSYVSGDQLYPSVSELLLRC